MKVLLVAHTRGARVKMFARCIQLQMLRIFRMQVGSFSLVLWSLSGAGPPVLGALYYRCPCPCMVVPMECLQYDWSSSSRSSAASSHRDPLLSSSHSRINAFGRQVSGPITARLRSFGSRQGSLKALMAAKPSPLFRGSQRHESSTIDNAQIGPQSMGVGVSVDSTQSLLDVIRDEEIELEAIEELDLDQAAELEKQECAAHETGQLSTLDDEEGEDPAQDMGDVRTVHSAASAPLLGEMMPSTSWNEPADFASGPPYSAVMVQALDSSKNDWCPRADDDVVDTLKQQLAEKDEEILKLREQISKLTHTPRQN